MALNTNPIVVAAFIIGIQSCGSPSQKKEDLGSVAVDVTTVFVNDSRQELKKVGEIALALDEHSSYEFYNVRYEKFDEKEFLYVLNQLNTSLDIYSIDEQKLINRIKYNSEGPEGIQQAQGFTVATQDSIFLFPKFGLKGSLLINNNGEILNQYNPTIQDDEIPGHINHISANSNQTYYHGQKLYFHRYPFFEVGDPNFHYDFYFDIKSNEVKWIDFSTLPEEYLQNKWLSYYYIGSRTIISENEWVYSWSMLDSLIYIRQENDKVEKRRYYAGDERMSAPLLEPINGTPEQYAKLKQDMTNYGQLLYSPEQDYFYRILYLKPEEKLEIGPIDNSIFEKRFLIIILNRNFEVISKTLFDAGVYDPRLMFAGASGIYIPKIHPKYQQLNEDQIVYDIYGVSD